MIGHILRLNLQKILIKCCEKLNNFEEAFHSTKDLFYEDNDYQAYKRARYFAKKVNNFEDFIKEAEIHLSSKNSDGYPWTIIEVLSYEGKVDKLLNLVKKLSGYEQYYYLKYTCRSLLYRAFYGEKLNYKNINNLEIFIFRKLLIYLR